MEIVFSDDEIRMEEENGRLKICVPLATVLAKLPDTAKVKADTAYRSREEADAAFTEKLSGVCCRSFLEKNLAKTASGKRSMGVYTAMLDALAELTAKYGQMSMNAALAMCLEPRQCTIPYLKAVLKNRPAENPKNTSAGMKAWRIVCANIHQASRCHNKQFSDEKIHRIISEMGGWSAVVLWQQKDLPRLQEQFLQKYAEVPKPEAEPEPKTRHTVAKPEASSMQDAIEDYRQKHPELQVADLAAGIGKNISAAKPQRTAPMPQTPKRQMSREEQLAHLRKEMGA